MAGSHPNGRGASLKAREQGAASSQSQGQKEKNPLGLGACRGPKMGPGMRGVVLHALNISFMAR